MRAVATRSETKKFTLLCPPPIPYCHCSIVYPILSWKHPKQPVGNNVGIDFSTLPSGFS